MDDAQPVIQNAFVLGAGLGTRLRPLTARRPKPLIPVANRPLITYAFDQLLASGVTRLVVNTHWRSEAYRSAFPDSSYRQTPISFRDEQPEILETAGGIWNVRDLLGDGPFLVYNGDVFSDLPLKLAIRAHFSLRNEVTLIVRSHGGPLQIAFDPATSRVTDIGGRVDSDAAPRFLFTGMYIVNPEFIRRIRPGEKISVIKVFCEMIRQGAPLGAVLIDEGEWQDLGSRGEYLAAHVALGVKNSAPWIHPSALVSPSAKIDGATAIGAHCQIGDNVKLNDCILWEGAEIALGSVLDQCIVTDGQQVEGIHSDADF